jgi:hypothetical protein
LSPNRDFSEEMAVGSPNIDVISKTPLTGFSASLLLRGFVRTDHFDKIGRSVHETGARPRKAPYPT